MRLGPRSPLGGHSPDKPPQRDWQIDRPFQGLKVRKEFCGWLSEWSQEEAEVLSALLEPGRAWRKRNCGLTSDGGCLLGMLAAENVSLRGGPECPEERSTMAASLGKISHAMCV